MNVVAMALGKAKDWGRRLLDRSSELVRTGVNAVRDAMNRAETAVLRALAPIRLAVVRWRMYVAASAAASVGMLLSAAARAFTAPAVGDFGYDIYDIVVNRILNGPIGFIGGVALIVFGATKIMTNWMMTILCIIAGTILIRADDLVVTLGALI